MNKPFPAHDDILASTEFADVPETFAMRGEGGFIQQIREPCYNLLADGFYGDTLYEEGEIITTGICPNDHMQPLNRAAAVNILKWRKSLPKSNVTLSIEDTVEAANRLRDDPRTKDMNHDQFSELAYKLAMEIKTRRDGAQAELYLPAIGGQAVRQAGAGKAPPMPNTRFTDPSHTRPGQLSAATGAVLHEPKLTGGNVQRAKPAMGNAPTGVGR